MNRYTAAGLDVARRAKRLLKKQSYHEPLLKARVRIDYVFAESVDGEDGDPVKVGGYPATAATSIVPQKFRINKGADARITIDKAQWNDLTERQKDATLDEQLYHLVPIINESTVATDGNDRPRLRLRKYDFRICGFSVIAKEHGEHSQEVIASRALVEHAADVFLPGFEVMAKPLPGQKKAKADGKVVAMPKQQQDAPQQAAAR